MVRVVIKNIFKVTFALLSILLLFLFFSRESITFSVPSSISEFSTYMESQNQFKAVVTETEQGYCPLTECEAYERQFLVEQDFVNLCIKKYNTVAKAQENYELLKQKKWMKMTFDINGNSYIRFKIGNVNYCAWRNQETIVTLKSISKESLQIFKAFIVKKIS